MRFPWNIVSSSSFFCCFWFSSTTRKVKVSVWLPARLTPTCRERNISIIVSTSDPLLHEKAQSDGFCVLPLISYLDAALLVDVVSSVCGDAVCSSCVVLPNCPHHPPTAPVAPHHPLHLAVEEAVGEADDEALRRRDHGLHGVGGGDQERNPNASHRRVDQQGHDITHTEQRHHKYQRLKEHCFKVRSQGGERCMVDAFQNLRNQIKEKKFTFAAFQCLRSWSAAVTAFCLNLRITIWIEKELLLDEK